MKKNTLVLVLVLLFTFSASPIFAHPGNTAADGCHYCRTRCDYWGVAWNQRHCHGGNIYIPSSEPKYESIQPTATPTVKPTSTVTPIVTTQPTQTPQVQGTSTNGSSVFQRLVVVITFLGGSFLGLKWLAKKTAPNQ